MAKVRACVNLQLLDADVADAAGGLAADADAGEDAVGEGAVGDGDVFGGDGGVGADWEAASAPRPDLSEMQSSPVAMSQWSMRTCLQESMSMPSPLPPVERMVRFLMVMFWQSVGWIDHMS